MAVRADLCDHPGILRPVVVDEDADATRQEDQDQGYDDVDVRYGFLQVREALAVQVEQERHHAESQYGGAGGHHDAAGADNMYSIQLYNHTSSTEER